MAVIEGTATTAAAVANDRRADGGATTKVDQSDQPPTSRTAVGFSRDLKSQGIRLVLPVT